MIYFLIPLGALLFLFACIAPFFVLKRLSPIPYFPSNAHDISLILKQTPFTNTSVFYDLGAGDGVVVFAAASVAHKNGLSARFIAYEINPYLLLVMRIRRLFHPNRANIEVRRGDIFSTDYPLSAHKKITFFTYISPWFMEKTVANVALMVGNETFGVLPETLALCDAVAELPMWGVNKSLNVIVSAAIASYHVAHQLKL